MRQINQGPGHNPNSLIAILRRSEAPQRPVGLGGFDFRESVCLFVCLLVRTEDAIAMAVAIVSSTKAASDTRILGAFNDSPQNPRGPLGIQILLGCMQNTMKLVK